MSSTRKSHYNTLGQLLRLTCISCIFLRAMSNPVVKMFESNGWPVLTDHNNNIVYRNLGVPECSALSSVVASLNPSGLFKSTEGGQSRTFHISEDLVQAASDCIEKALISAETTSGLSLKFEGRKKFVEIFKKKLTELTESFNDNLKHRILGNLAKTRITVSPGKRSTYGSVSSQQLEFFSKPSHQVIFFAEHAYKNRELEHMAKELICGATILYVSRDYSTPCRW